MFDSKKNSKNNVNEYDEGYKNFVEQHKNDNLDDLNKELSDSIQLKEKAEMADMFNSPNISGIGALAGILTEEDGAVVTRPVGSFIGMSLISTCPIFGVCLLFFSLAPDDLTKEVKGKIGDCIPGLGWIKDTTLVSDIGKDINSFVRTEIIDPDGKDIEKNNKLITNVRSTLKNEIKWTKHLINKKKKNNSKSSNVKVQ